MIFEYLSKNKSSPKKIINFLKLNYFNFNPNEVDENGNNLLHESVAIGNIKLIEYVLKIGTNPNTLNNDNQLPLKIALKNNKENVIKTLLISKKIDMNITTEYDMTMLHEAVLYDVSVDIARLLLDYGCDLNQVDESNMTPLHLAIENDCYALSKLFILSKADMTIKNVDGVTALDLIKKSNVEKIKTLIEIK